MDLAKEIEELAMNFEACQKTLSAMGDETRQHIILEMMRMDYHGSRVPDITERTNLSRPAVSHHLQILKDAGIVKMRKEGTMTYYYLDPDMESFTRLSNALLQAVQIFAALFRHFLRQEVRHGDGTVALFCLWRGDLVFTVYPLIGLADRGGALLQVEVRWRQRQQLAFPHTAPVQKLESIEGFGLIHHGVGKFQVFFLRPEQHFPGLLLSKRSGFAARVFPEIVILHSMVEDGGQLVLYGAEIDRRVRLSILVTEPQHFILPGHDDLRRYSAHFQLSEVRDQFRPDDMILRAPGIFLQPCLQILGIVLHKAGE